MKKHAVLLDWLRYTVPVDTRKDEYLPPHRAFDLSGEILTPYPNYTEVAAMVCGRADWHSSKPEQRLMVTLTGKDLDRMREMGITDKMLCLWVMDVPGLHVTRLDLAIDTNDTRISPQGVLDDWGTERFTTRARTISEIKCFADGNVYKGHTVYVGSRSSEQFMRVYDKAAEQGTSDHLTRIELELKSHPAFEALATIARSGLSDAIWAIAGRFFKWANAGWQDLASGSTIKVARLAKPEKSGHQKWVRTVALPAVIEAYRQGDAEVTMKIKKLTAPRECDIVDITSNT